MRRRTVLLAACGLAVAGCGQVEATPRGRTSAQPLPSTGGRRVAEWMLVDGFLPLGVARLRPPRLAVYPDGAAVADARRMLTLDRDEVFDLVAELWRDLAGLPSTVPLPRAGQLLMDAPTTQLGVVHADGSLRRVRAYAPDILDGYPQPLRTAHARLTALADRVRATGTGYTADRIRIVATLRPDTNTMAQWPATVPVPSIVDRGHAAVEDVRIADLAGPAARTATADLPREAHQPAGEWPILHTPGDDDLAVAWRYLLPDE